MEERQVSDVATLLFADYTVSSILDKISRAKLDLKPAYQVRSGMIAHMILYSVFSRKVGAVISSLEALLGDLGLFL
jgi:hypothetical protein